MRVVFAEPAERDLDSIVTYIANENPAAAEKALNLITIIAVFHASRDFARAISSRSAAPRLEG
jgi:plasmid stabilization system protein ParE